MTIADVTPPPTAEPTLSQAMRTGSRAEHEAAESSTFMAELLDGRINERGYAAYLLRLRAVYATLEECLRARAGDPVVAAVHDPALERLAAIDADLEHWAPGADREVDSPAAVAYRDRLLAAAAADTGGRLAAHHYTRYLGDLSGGQAIGRILDRCFELDGAGISFYGFAEIPKPKPYKDAYRARLDALDLDDASVAEVVAEVKVAFGMNQALFTELGTQLDEFRR
ncbi:MAG: biliverdin-producing heme oxygenase [Actinobacteria bacterium]|nr:biliverdin-producing heme oxygenase [Actinomycetota bacterium]